MRRDPFFLRCLPRAAMFCSAGVLLQATGGCDPAIRAIILSGFQDLTVSLVDAIFQQVAAEDELTTGTGSGLGTGSVGTGSGTGTDELGDTAGPVPPTLGSGTLGTGTGLESGF